MRGPRLFDHTDWKSEKRPSRPQMSCFHGKYRYSEEQKKGRLYTSTDVLFSTEKKVSIVRDEASHFLRGPRFQPA